jgi:hypothetical protein
MNTTPTPPPGLSVISAQQQRANELAKIAKTQIVFKIGGLTEENFAYAQQEIQAVSLLNRLGLSRFPLPPANFFYYLLSLFFLGCPPKSR